jgi:erythromycin esterase-like protein
MYLGTDFTRLRRWLAVLVSSMLMTTALASDDGGRRAQWLAQLRQHAQPLRQNERDYDRLLASIGEARVVMLGESTHGSAEFFQERARISQRLIAEKGFTAVILEAAWAPTLRLNAYIQGTSDASAPHDAAQALQGFRLFPRWTWRHADFAAFVEALRLHNAGLPAHQQRVALYGMDIYEAPQAVDDVLDYLRAAAPTDLRRARRDYRCFAPYRSPERDPSLYGRDLKRGWMPNCAGRVAARRQHIAALQTRQPSARGDAAVMSARAVVGAEAYYRLLYAEGALASWNARERFLAESIELALARHGKVLVWAHNTHQGDARASLQGDSGELSIGQLMRERLGDSAVFLLGMSTHSGTVRSASGWATRDRIKTLRPAHGDSWPGLFHEVGLPAFLIDFRSDPALALAFDASWPDRAIGVNYYPNDEQRSHYLPLRISRSFDAVIHIDVTRAVQILE